MQCLNCSENFDLGIRKPMKFCCSLLCYSCLFELTIKSSSPDGHPRHCSKCNTKILNITTYSSDSSLITQMSLENYKKTFIHQGEGLCSTCQTQSEVFSRNPTSPAQCHSCLSLKLHLKLSPVLCSQGHKFHLKTENPKKSDCLFCKNKMNAKLTCFECFLDICYYCTDLLISMIFSTRFVKCWCEGEIIWINNLKSKKCNFCKENFENIGSFFCPCCGKSRCLYCFLEVFKDLNCFSCKVLFSAEVIPKVGRNGQVFCGICTDFQGLNEDSGLNTIFKAICRGRHKIDTYSNYLKPCFTCGVVQEGLRCGRCQSSFCISCYKWLCHSQAAPYSKCLQGHEVRRVAISSEFHDLKQVVKSEDPYGVNRVICRSCNKKMRILSYMCLTCKSDQCEDCYQFLSRIDIIPLACQCENPGQLTYLYYNPCITCETCQKSFEKSGSFICSSCKSLKCLPCVSSLSKKSCTSCKKPNENNESLLKTSTYNHPFCSTCFERLSSSNLCDDLSHQLSISRQNQINCQKHLFSSFQSTEVLPCSNCKKELKSLFSCLDCKILLCLHCKIWELEAISISNNFKCLKGHQLKLIPFAQRLYNRSGKYYCDGCDQKVSGMSFHCFQCNLDYCPVCFFSVLELLEIFTRVSCFCTQKFKWISVKNNLKCFSCKKKLKKTGYFICLGCVKPHCIKCSLKVAQKLQMKQVKKESLGLKLGRFFLGYE